MDMLFTLWVQLGALSFSIRLECEHAPVNSFSDACRGEKGATFSRHCEG